MRIAVLVAALVLAGCGEAVDTSSLPPIDGYTGWHRIDLSGEVPGHGDTHSIVFVNAVGLEYAGSGTYADGTVIVKEVRDPEPPGGAGDLRYIAIMRKVGDGGDPELPVDGGWVFTQWDGEGDEVHKGLCWGCHEDAPFDGAFADYGQ